MTLGEVFIEVHTIVFKVNACGGFCFSARQMYAELVSTLGISLSQFGAQKRTFAQFEKEINVTGVYYVAANVRVFRFLSKQK